MSITKMSFSKDEFKGPQPVPPGQYTVRLVGFKPKTSKSGTSVNLNPQVDIVEPSEYANQKIFTNLNSSIPGFIQDFVHSFGFQMEEDGDGLSIPGAFVGAAEDIESKKYEGPLTGRTAKWEIRTRTYEGREQNEVRKFICAVPDCAEKNPNIKHSSDMQRKG